MTVTPKKARQSKQPSARTGTKTRSAIASSGSLPPAPKKWLRLESLCDGQEGSSTPPPTDFARTSALATRWRRLSRSSLATKLACAQLGSAPWVQFATTLALAEHSFESISAATFALAEHSFESIRAATVALAERRFEAKNAACVSNSKKLAPQSSDNGSCSCVRDHLCCYTFLRQTWFNPGYVICKHILACTLGHWICASL